LVDLLIVVGAFATYYRHSIVHLRYSHEGGARKWIEKHGSSIIVAILGAGAGILLKKLADHWLK